MGDMSPEQILGPLGWVGSIAAAGMLIWLLLNPRIRALAWLTTLESIRRMEFQAILLLALTLFAGIGYLLFAPGIKESPLWGVVISQIGSDGLGAPGVNTDPRQIFFLQFDYYMQSAMSFFAELFALFMLLALGLFLISNDIQQGFLLTLLPKPLSRGEYLWGRGLGLAITVGAAWIIMGLQIFLLFLIKNPAVLSQPTAPEWKILFCTAVLLMKWASLVAILFFLTLRMPPVAGGLVVLLLFVAGHISSNVHDLATNVALDWPLRLLFWSGYVAMPHYDRAWSAIILDPTANLFQTHTDVAGFVGWAFTYAMVMGLGSWLCFRHRDL